jgi:hypothetical protein
MRARTSLITCFLVIGFTAPASAQFGLRGGVNLTKFVGGSSDSDTKSGLNLGATVPLIRLGPLSIVPEIYYSQKGAQGFDAAQVTNFRYSLDYIEVPVLAKLSFPISGQFLKFYVAGGPAYAWNLKCEFTAESDPNATAQDCGQNFGSFNTAMKSADRGIVGSAGLDFNFLGLGGVNLDARMVRGLARLRDDAAGEGVKNQAFSLMLGYYLGR